MKFRNIADLHNKTTAILKDVQKNGYVVITNHGRPEAIIKKFSEDDIEDFILSGRALSNISDPYKYPTVKTDFLIGEGGVLQTSSEKTFKRKLDNNEIEDIFKKIIKVLKSYNATIIKVFGSFARGDFTGSSDIDLLVRFSEKKSLIDLVKIEDFLISTIGLKVDLLTENSLSPDIRKKVDKEAKLLYEKS